MFDFLKPKPKLPRHRWNAEQMEEWVRMEPCESCLDHGWHWIAFSGDTRAWRESCLVPGCIEWGDPRFDIEDGEEKWASVP